MCARRWLLAIVSAIAVAIGLGVLWRGSAVARPPHDEGSTSPAGTTVPQKTYRRIVSLSPSITESLFALGLGERVVGVTDFCDYPPEATTRSKVGGYYDLNYEAVVALSPDLMVCLPEHADLLDDLDRLDLSHLTVNHRRVEAILKSLTTLGQTFGVLKQAEVLVETIRARLQAVQGRTIDETRPRVLVCVGSQHGIGHHRRGLRRRTGRLLR